MAESVASGVSGAVTASEVDQANADAIRRIRASDAILVGLAAAGSVVPGIGEDELLHAGPPLAGWQSACGALRGAVIGTLLHENRATDTVQAEELAASGELRLVPASNYGILATYGGVITRATTVFIVENRVCGTRAFAAINEGRGKALRYGSHDPDTLSRYAWLESTFAPILNDAVIAAGGINLFGTLRHALQMGDEGHSRQKAASSLFANLVSPHVATTSANPREAGRVIEFLAQNEIFHLPLTMAAAKATMLSAENVPNSTLVTCMAGNGVEWGIKVSGQGSRWFTAPVPSIEGTYSEGFGAADASPVIGDSEIAETLGLGAFAVSAAPALSRYVGGTFREAMRLSLDMYEITIAEHSALQIPALEFRGTPLGIDVRRVVATGIEPIFNTGIAHRQPGVGQIGAGYGRTPMACCVAALNSFGTISRFEAGPPTPEADS